MGSFLRRQQRGGGAATGGVASEDAGGQGARSGSAYLVASLATSGIMTFVFLGLAARSLDLARYGLVATLWSATLLFAPVLWTGVTQTLARYVSEREAKGEDWRPVVAGVRKLGLLLLVAFLCAVLLSSPLITQRIFGGEVILTLAFAAGVAFNALTFFKRGLLSGRRRFSRVGGTYVAESVARVCITAALLAAGLGVVGVAIGIALAPLFGFLAVRTPPPPEPEGVGAPFRASAAFRFTAPVLLTMACAQAIANGGALLLSALGDADAYAQAGLLVAALTLVRAPQSLLSPAIGNLLPHLSRISAQGDHRQLRLFVGRAIAIVCLVGAGLVGGTWLLGGFAMRLVYGSGFVVDQRVLVVLASLVALYLLCELLNQVLFARGLAWAAAASWVLGLAVAIGFVLLSDINLLERVSYGFALGTLSTAVAQGLCLVTVNQRARKLPSNAEKV